MPFLLPAALTLSALAILVFLIGLPGWAMRPYEATFSLWFPGAALLIMLSWILAKRKGKKLNIPDPFLTGLMPRVTVGAPAMIAVLLLLAFPFRLLEDAPNGAGDSLHLNEFIPVASHLFGFLTTPDELLELFIRSRLFMLFEGRLSPATSLGLYSYVAAFAWLGGVMWFTASMPPRSRILAWLILFFTPRIALFAGYVETYSMATALVSIITLIGWRSLEETNRNRQTRMLRLIAALAGLAALHHMIVGMLLPGLVILTWQISGGKVRTFLKEATVCGGIGAAILGIGFGAFALSPHSSMIFAESHAGSANLVSATAWLAPKNLAKLGNLFLLFPLPVAWVLAQLGTRLGKRPKPVPPAPQSNRRAIRVFLWSTFLPFLFQALIWKSSIGFPADWDLFSFFMGPLHILILHDIFLRNADDGAHSAHTTSLIFAVSTVTLVPALIWMSWLHRDTPATIANREYLSSVQTHFIPKLMADTELDSLSDARKKNYARVSLFAFRVNFLKDHVSLEKGERDGLVHAMEQGMNKYRAGLHDPDDSYNASFAEAQKDFYRVFEIVNGRQVTP